MQLDLQVIPPWLDEETSALVREKAELLAQRHPDVLAIILYGSVARHEERSLGGPDPSDVDLLVVVNGNREAVRSQILALVHTAGLAEDRHLGAPREVKVMFSSRTSREWDPDFIANVKRDGRILYQRGELPAPFACIGYFGHPFEKEISLGFHDPPLSPCQMVLRLEVAGKCFLCTRENRRVRAADQQ